MVWESGYPNKAVVKKTFQFSNGTEREFFLWGKRAGSSVVAFPVTEQNEVVAVRQWRPGADGFVYELPGGNGSAGQSPEEALANELREETGYAAVTFVPLPEFWVDPPSCQTVIKPFLALGCRKVGELTLDAGERVEPFVVDLEKWIQLVTSNTSPNMRDGKTLAITMLALHELISRGIVDKSIASTLLN